MKEKANERLEGRKINLTVATEHEYDMCWGTGVVGTRSTRRRPDVPGRDNFVRQQPRREMERGWGRGRGMAPQEQPNFRPPMDPMQVVPNQPNSFTALPIAQTLPEPHDQPTDFSSLTSLHKRIFHIIDFNCAWNSGGMCVPCEIAVVTFTLELGEQRFFHRFIDPSPIPKCYIADAIHATKFIHGIPHRNFTGAEKNINKIWNELCQYLDPNTTGIPDTIYARGPHVPNVCLSWISYKAGKQNLFKSVRFVEEFIDYFHQVTISLNKPTSSVQDYFDPVDNLTKAGNPCPWHAQESQKGGADQINEQTNTYKCAIANARHCAHIIKSVWTRYEIKKIREKS